MKRGTAALAWMMMAGAALAQGSQPYSAALVTQANAGDPAAQYALGEAYRSGNGIAADRDQAISWFAKAAPRDTRAADELGVLLFVKGERAQAIPLLQAASLRGDAHALYILGTARFNGDYVPKDVGAAYAEMRLAAQKGLPEAQRSLALMEPHVTPEERTRADQLAFSPESGAFPVPPPAAPRGPVSPPIRTVTASAAPPVTTPAQSMDSATAAPASVATIEAPPPTTAPAMAASSPPPPPVRKPAPVKPPVVVADVPKPAANGVWKVQLAAVGAPGEVEGEWKRLSKKAPFLTSLRHSSATFGPVTRIYIIGLASRADASALCQKVVAAKLGCLPVAP